MHPPSHNSGYGALPMEIDVDEAQWHGISAETVEKYKLAFIMLLVIVLGPINFVLYKIMFESYGEGGSFFVSNAVNVIYVIIGGVALAYADFKGEISDEVKQTSHVKFIVMASCDGVAGFLAAMGAVYTSGAAQQLLNQTLIPWTMLTSFFMLGKGSTMQQMVGAGIILGGVGVVLTPHILASAGVKAATAETAAYHTHSIVLVASIVYGMANLPFAISFAYKEFGFKDLNIHPVHLTQWVSVYQCIIGIIIMPLQMIPGLGSEDGMTIAESVEGIKYGWRCFLQEEEECAQKHSFALLVSYCAVNFLYNLAGLYLVKHGSSILNAISGAIILPLTVLSFTSPLLGQFKEKFDIMTLVGLIVVLTGFGVWKHADLTTSMSESPSSDSLFASMESSGHIAQSSLTPTKGGKFDFKEMGKKMAISPLDISFTPRTNTRTPNGEGTRISFQERVIPGVIREV